ncbi:MAG: hypothetical protein QOC55_434, partial [Thermoleophilaceae bacterium]|nr:hypothetical protein [Thermoleophilaceae bacterium]
LAGAWFVSAARTTGLERHPERREGAPRWWDADRVAMTALAIAAVVFGLHSAIDWTWFVPGPAVMAILVAGYVAGRGPAPQPAGTPAAIVAAGPPLRPLVNLPRLPSFRLRLPPRPRTERLVPALLVAVVALIAAWAAYQPYRADAANNNALDLLQAGKLGAAETQAKRSHSIDPASVRPLWAEAAIDVARHDLAGAEVLYQRAVFDQPSNPDAWTRLAEFELYRNNKPAQALDIISGALYLDPHSAPAQTVFFDARTRQRATP